MSAPSTRGRFVAELAGIGSLSPSHNFEIKTNCFLLSVDEVVERSITEGPVVVDDGENHHRQHACGGIVSPVEPWGVRFLQASCKHSHTNVQPLFAGTACVRAQTMSCKNWVPGQESNSPDIELNDSPTDLSFKPMNGLNEDSGPGGGRGKIPPEECHSYVLDTEKAEVKAKCQNK
eukprot:1136295-Pelagomonas_calceolata.AAC.6